MNIFVAPMKTRNKREIHRIHVIYKTYILKVLGQTIRINFSDFSCMIHGLDVTT